MPDYIMRWLASRFLDDVDVHEDLGILTPEVRARKEAQQALFADDTAGPGRQRRNGNGNGNGHGGAAEAKAAQPATAVAAAEAALTDTPPVRPGEDAGPRARPGVRAVRRHDAAHGLLLHVLELRQQHRLRLSPGLRARLSRGPRPASWACG